MVTLSFLLPGQKLSDMAFYRAGICTFDGVRLGQLSTVLQQCLGYRGPAVTGLQSQVDVGTGKIVDMKLRLD